MANVLASFAHYERCLIGQLTKDALEIRQGQGIRLAPPRAISTGLAERIVSECQKGSRCSIANALTAEGVPTVHGGVRWPPRPA
jgi:hypothetical protein